MPRGTPDPLDNIMRMLRGKGAVDPNQVAARGARMQTERRRLGAAPVAPARSGPAPAGGYPTGGAVPAPQGMPSREEGMDTEMTVPQNAIPIVVDALNESIIALKVEIHRTQDKEQRRHLETQAEKLRQQILEFGGEPIWADESVEEGLQKLRGVGYVGEAFDFGQVDRASMDVKKAQENYDAAKAGGINTASAYDQLRQAQAAYDKAVAAANAARAAAASTPTPPASSGGGGGSSYTPPTQPTATPGMYSGQVSEPPDRLSQLLQDIGYNDYSISGPPKSTAVDTLNRMIEEYGLAPRSQEEIEEHARAITERSTLARTQIIQREIDRFEESFPNEFEKAKERINKAAAEVSAERQEEMAARGMFYSSVMSGALTSIDEQTLEMINDISMEAARYVNDLERQITDIEEMAVLEQEVLAYQMMQDERQFGLQLTQIHTQVAMFADQLALDAWYNQSQLQLQQRGLQLQEVQLRIQEAERVGQHLASAFMSNHPLVQSGLSKMGISPKAFGAMPLEAQSNLVNQVVGFEQVSQQMRMNEVQMQAILANMAIEQQRLDLDRQKLDLMLQENQGPTAKYHPEAYAEGAKAVGQGNIGLATQIVGSMRDGGYTSSADALEALIREAKAKIDKPKYNIMQDVDILVDFIKTGLRGPF